MILFFQQWRGELLKLFARRRTYIGFGVFVALEALLLLRIHFKGITALRQFIIGSGGTVDYYFSAITVAFLIVSFSVFLLGALYLTLVAGDIVAKESEDGHMRLLLARPVGRFRLLLIKYLTCTCYAVFLIQFLAWTAFVLGLLLRGWGGGFFFWTLDAPFVSLFEWSEGLERYAIGTLAMGFCMTVMSSMAFFLSCFPIKPAAATIGALSYMLVDFILRNNDFMEGYKHLLITQHMSIWIQFMAEHINWPLVFRGAAVLIAANITLFTLGYAVFESRDLKS
jgi:ABC-2 type transport system permease protein